MQAGTGHATWSWNGTAHYDNVLSRGLGGAGHGPIRRGNRGNLHMM